ncbi:MAG: helix-turn-helix transcriptional regulator [Oscillospiraceae bacterium]
MLEKTTLDFLAQTAKAIACQFGGNCEVVVHDLNESTMDSSIVAIENGHVTYRKVGDGPSQVVLEALHGDRSKLKDQLGYLTRTPDGRILKSSTVYVRNAAGEIDGIFAINFDITPLMLIDSALGSIVSVEEPGAREPQKITQNVNDLLDELIVQSVKLVGKPVALMNKADKITAIRFLSDHGAFLITKSGDKVSRHFGISKYTLYSYLDTANQSD